LNFSFVKNWIKILRNRKERSDLKDDFEEIYWNASRKNEDLISSFDKKIDSFKGNEIKTIKK